MPTSADIHQTRCLREIAPKTIQLWSLPLFREHFSTSLWQRLSIFASLIEWPLSNYKYFYVEQFVIISTNRAYHKIISWVSEVSKFELWTKRWPSRTAWSNWLKWQAKLTEHPTTFSKFKLFDFAHGNQRFKFFVFQIGHSQSNYFIKFQSPLALFVSPSGSRAT